MEVDIEGCMYSYIGAHDIELTAKEMHAKVIAPHNDPSLDEPDILRFLWRTYFWPGTLPAYRQEKTE